MSKIAVIGTGYVGLVTGTCFAETGNQVTCVDIDVRKVERLQKGEIPIYEPGLDVLFDRNVAEGRLLFTTNLAEGIKDAQVIFLALPTPPGEDGSAGETRPAQQDQQFRCHHADKGNMNLQQMPHVECRSADA